MAKRDNESGTALLDAPTTAAEQKPITHPPATPMRDARDRFVNQCLRDYALAEFLAQRGCDPSPVLVEGMIKRAGRIFDALFEKRPFTNNL